MSEVIGSEPNIPSGDRIELIQNLADLLSYELSSREDETTPIPEEVFLEIEEDLDKTAKIISGTPYSSQALCVNTEAFLSVDHDEKSIVIVVNESAKVPKDFRVTEKVVVGGDTVVGNGCVSKSPIGKNVMIGDDTSIGKGGMIGSFDHERWGNRPLQIGSRVTLGNGVKVSPSVQIGDDVNVGNNVKIGYVKIDKNPDLQSRTFISSGTVIGDGAIVEPGASIGRGYEIISGTHIPKGLYLPSHLGKVIKVDDNYIRNFLWEQRRNEREKAQQTC